jgi:tetratricopeptide (TPR) repeat protein
LLSPIASGASEAIDSSNDRLLSIQPVFPYFLQVRLNESTVETQSALQDGFKNHYRSLAGSYSQLMQSKDSQEKRLGILFCRLEYENLHAALQTCLKKQESFSGIFCCLYRYFLANSDKQGMLKIAEEVNEVLETYPVALIQGELGYKAMIALEYLANAYLEAKQFDRAKQSYQNKLEVIAALQSIDARQKGLSTANTYHQALAIFVEFGDRYSQASTYHGLGHIAFDVEEIAEAQENFLQALQFWAEFNDKYSIQTFSWPALAKVYQSHPTPELITAVAEILGVSEAEVQQIFDSMNQGT